MFDRVRENQERPEALSALNNMLNISEMFYLNAKNVSEDEQIFSEVELNSLNVLIEDIKTWVADGVAELNTLPDHVNPTKLTLRAIAEKMASLDREVKYLLNKARVTPPKKKVKKDEDAKKVSTILLCVSPLYLPPCLWLHFLFVQYD